MRGRFYSPAWHRFMNSNQGVDPNLINQFGYTVGSPLMMTDPTGMDALTAGADFNRRGTTGVTSTGVPGRYCSDFAEKYSRLSDAEKAVVDKCLEKLGVSGQAKAALASAGSSIKSLGNEMADIFPEKLLKDNVSASAAIARGDDAAVAGPNGSNRAGVKKAIRTGVAEANIVGPLPGAGEMISAGRLAVDLAGLVDDHSVEAAVKAGLKTAKEVGPLAGFSDPVQKTLDKGNDALDKVEKLDKATSE